MAAQLTPSFLGRRRGKKVTQGPAREANATDTSNASTSDTADSPNAPTHLQNAKPGRAKPKAQTGRKAGKGKGEEGEGALQSLDEPGRVPMTGSAIVALASRPDVLAELEEIRPGAMRKALGAMLDGATQKGASGAADRAAFWRMTGMPWVGEGGSAKQVGAVLGAALGEAVARIEDHRGHQRVTVDMRADAKVLADQGD